MWNPTLSWLLSLLFRDERKPGTTAFLKGKNVYSILVYGDIPSLLISPPIRFFYLDITSNIFYSLEVEKKYPISFMVLSVDFVKTSEWTVSFICSVTVIQQCHFLFTVKRNMCLITLCSFIRKSWCVSCVCVIIGDYVLYHFSFFIIHSTELHSNIFSQLTLHLFWNKILRFAHLLMQYPVVCCWEWLFEWWTILVCILVLKLWG